MDALAQAIDAGLIEHGTTEVMVVVRHPHSGEYHLVVADNPDWDVTCCGDTAGLDWWLVATGAVPWELMCNDCLQSVGSTGYHRSHMARAAANSRSNAEYRRQYRERHAAK